MKNLDNFGVSFSLKYALEMGINPRACLEAALKDLGVKKLRLMSYWDIHEPEPGKYDFKDLDWQFKLAKKYNAKISLAIGLRQPRWPESHWPQWIKDKNNPDWQSKLYDYIKVVVEHYKDHPCLESWQLENEALLKIFGLDGNFDRQRLKTEFTLVKKLDSAHPIIMTTSDSWGIPLGQPKPDIFGISIYKRFYDRGKYRRSRRPPLFYKVRAIIIQTITHRPVFIHELQTEPWGPQATHGLSLDEQSLTMNAAYFEQTITYAKSTGLLPAYLWGLEWWYWLLTTKDSPVMWERAKELLI